MPDDARKVVNFRLSEEDARLLKARLAMEGRTIQEFFEEAAERYIAQHLGSGGGAAELKGKTEAAG